MRRIGRMRPEAIVLSGVVQYNGVRLIRDKVAVLGRNTGRVKLVATDGLLVPATIRRAGVRAVRGMYVPATGLPPGRLPSRGRSFVQAFRQRFGVDRVDPYAAYSAQAAEMILAAIAATDGSRAAVRTRLFSEPGRVELFERG